MPEKDTEAIARWYDALSKNYDELYGEEQAKKHLTVSQLLENKTFNLIVDVGCGTGRLLRLVSSKAQFGLGIDLSAQMLRKAKHRGRDTGIQFVQADAAHLPLQDQVADGVTSVSMTESGPSSQEHFNELSRIATKDATLIMTIFDDNTQIPWKPSYGTKLELVASFSNRERLYLLDETKNRAKESVGFSALL